MLFDRIDPRPFGTHRRFVPDRSLLKLIGVLQTLQQHRSGRFLFFARYPPNRDEPWRLRKTPTILPPFWPRWTPSAGSVRSRCSVLRKRRDWSNWLARSSRMSASRSARPLVTRVYGSPTRCAAWDRGDSSPLSWTPLELPRRPRIFSARVCSA